MEVHTCKKKEKYILVYYERPSLRLQQSKFDGSIILLFLIVNVPINLIDASAVNLMPRQNVSLQTTDQSQSLFNIPRNNTRRFIKRLSTPGVFH